MHIAHRDTAGNRIIHFGRDTKLCIYFGSKNSLGNIFLISQITKQTSGIVVLDFVFLNKGQRPKKDNKAMPNNLQGI